MKHLSAMFLGIFGWFGLQAMAADLPDLGGKEVVVVTENAYPPLQFVDPKSGDAIGWEYDAMLELASRLNFSLTIENSSWDAMIPAVSEGQYDVGTVSYTHLTLPTIYSV